MNDEPELTRAIVHLDLDAFYAAVEVLENPELKNKPVIVGGRPEERGVVSTASYPARAYGIHSAMPTSRALRLCPEVIILPPRHRLYRERSQQVMSILRQMTSRIEQVSIDEAYLDLTDNLAIWEDAVDLARQLQQRVAKETKLSASLGVATNKLVAKVASDRDKPGGLTIVRPGEEASFLAPLPVRVLWGIGPKTAKKLHAALDVSTVGELAQRKEQDLVDLFGSQGAAMKQQAIGIDKRPLVTEHVRKSISQERTFSRDIAQLKPLKHHLWRMSQSVAEQLGRAEMAAGTIVIKLRYADFSTLTRQITPPLPTDNEIEIYRAALTLLEQTWKRGQPLRLLGVAARNLCPPSGQLSLW
jgi:DNA polymerase-4